MTDYTELAEDAFEDSAQYEFDGIPLYFSYRHYYALLAIMKEAEMSAEEQVLLIFWVATHSGDKVKELRKKWRNDKDLVFEEFENAPEKFNLSPGSPKMIDIASIAHKMWEDVEKSKDEVVENKKEIKGEQALPKK
tara:strand:+ start:3774 stop:4181 length:408 start_codon:yes stop_codon:yes gene_type:complete